MRKQTKLVAVLSAAALLAIGASMTSFAAGWQKDDDGTWHYYDRDDDMVTSEWKKDGSKWFYLDEDGNMLTDSWVDDDYYVGADGSMFVNQWVKTIADEDVDDPDNDGDHWYYFGSRGKKIVDQHKKINGKTYFFNEDGEMQDGWYYEGNDVYYLGEEDEGGRAENTWLWLELPDEDDDDSDQDHNWHGNKDCSLSCDEEGWYWFASDGKMFRDASKKKKINGKYYYFNKDGQMLYEWINTKADDSVGNALDGREGNVASSSTATPSKIAENMRYAEQVEEGWRGSGWYEMDGSEDVGTDGDTDWYYIDDGEMKKADITDPHDLVRANGGTAYDDVDPIYRARIKCEGKYYAFNEVGQMQDGIQWIDGSIYYFDENGYQKTGKVNSVEEEDDDTYAYYFKTTNGGNGKGYNGEKDGYLYWNGKRLEADDDYKFYRVDKKTYLVNNKGKIQKSSKKYDLEDFNAEDVYVSIDRDYNVKGYSIDGDKAKLVELKEEKIISLLKEKKIGVPSIAIYDNIFAPNQVYAGDFDGYFYTDDSSETVGTLDYAIANVAKGSTAKASVEEEAEEE